ncbi:hypothetical protein RDABS01_011789 [Bienertia sinuspersici]
MLLKAKHFHLDKNKFSGEIPSDLFSSRMVLIHIILNENQLSGNIPDTLGDVETLEVVRLDRNSLSGDVPPSLGTLTNVSELYLANNKLTRPIPDLSEMKRLTYVDLSNNNFDVADVPQWFETLPILTTLLMESTGLRGPISMALLNSPQLQTVTSIFDHRVLRNNQLNGTVEIAANISSSLRLLDLRNNSIDEFSSRVSNKSILLDENPFCLKPEAAGICSAVQPEKYFNFIPSLNCAPQTCFSDPILSSDCKRPYLGNLIFRSFNFSDLENMNYYGFLTNNLQPLLTSLQVPLDKVCLASSMIDRNGYLVLNISFFPPGGDYFNRTGISTVGNVLNNHIYPSPYGPYYYSDLPYTAFPVSWSDGDVPQLRGTRWFSLEDVKQCTNNFSHGSEIGVGGYGKVYKGDLDTGEVVAIKRAQQGSMQGALEFKTEIELLSRVHHKNVVNLVGFCYDKGKSGARLNWSRRLQIALGAARGLAYLHELADPPIIHRDVKADNILLGHHLNAKVADFGLSTLLSLDKGHVTTQVKGTLILTEKSDVYSFGVVMLELVTGRLPLEKNRYVVREVRETMKETGNVYNVVDPTIRSDSLIHVEEFVELAMECLKDTGDERPSMNELVKEIERMIEASHLSFDIESTTTSASFDVAGESGYPYSSNSDVSFGSRMSKPFLR